MNKENNMNENKKQEYGMNYLNKKILVFDLEVAPYDFENDYSEEEKQYLTKFAKNDEEMKAAVENLVFTPFTSQLVAIGMLQMEFRKPEKEISAKSFEDLKNQLDDSGQEYELKQIMGCVLINTGENGNENSEIKPERENVKYITSDEKTLIENFWNYISKNKYNLFITFNGREFDCPYIMLRSMIHNVKPSYNLMRGNDFNIKDYHVDLMKEMTFNKHSPTGARRKFSLDWYCKKLGIESPKSHGVTGDMVGEMFKQKKYKEIADYCYEDVIATGNLFEKWNNILNIK